MKIFHQIKHHPVEYLILFLALIFSSIAFFYFSFDKQLQRRIIYGASACYFFWSLYHHHRRGDLHHSIILEYLLFAVLAILIMTSTVF